MVGLFGTDAFDVANVSPYIFYPSRLQLLWRYVTLSLALYFLVSIKTCSNQFIFQVSGAFKIYVNGFKVLS